MDTLKMQWVECPLIDADGTTLHPPSCSEDEDDDNVIDLLSRREGHCAAIVAVTADKNKTSSPSTWIVVCGGYTRGIVSAVPLVAPTSLLPLLQWSELPAVDEFECDGASLTTLRATACVVGSPGDDRETGNGSKSNSVAYLFGGFDSEIKLRNTLYAVMLCGEARTSDGSATWSPTAINVREVSTTGHVPTPRARHGAGGIDSRLFIFGGETAVEEQTNDLHVCDVHTGVWRKVNASSPAPCPAPRLLSLSLVFVSPTAFVLYGGSHFANGAVQSFSDVWRFDMETETWMEVVIPAVDENKEISKGLPISLPRSNGHVGGAVTIFVDAAYACTCAIFMGGKDISEGDDNVKVIGFSSHSTDGAAEVRVCPALPAVGTQSFPHWRYTPAVVTTDRGLLLLAGQCRHAQVPSSFLLTFA